jgi:hypothetical protein
VQRIKLSQKITEDKWISPEKAMEKLRIKSKTTLQKLRDEGRIRFTQPDKKIILYDSDSAALSKQDVGLWAAKEDLVLKK